jgi:hypothetical protein
MRHISVKFVQRLLTKKQKENHLPGASDLPESFFKNIITGDVSEVMTLKISSNHNVNRLLCHHSMTKNSGPSAE